MTTDTETARLQTAATVSPDRVNGRFAPGNRLGPGRPRRGESVPEKLRAKVERHGDKVVEAVYQRLLRTDSVGNRAFADVRDTIYGIPKQHLVIEQSDSPLASVLASLHMRADYRLADVSEPYNALPSGVITSGGDTQTARDETGQP